VIGNIHLFSYCCLKRALKLRMQGDTQCHV
jgi:hypothetical protein